MSNVILYKGMEKTVAYTEVVAALEKAARQIAMKAQADLSNKAAHPYSRGYSYVSMAHGHLDRYVTLTDRDPDNAPSRACRPTSYRLRSARARYPGPGQ